MSTHEREALRQQMLLRALLGDARPGVVAGWLREAPGLGRRVESGLGAYRSNAGAVAERALAAAFPTLQQLIGAESFAALARDFWRRQPPLAGDIGIWGERLPAFVADAPSLADEPCLADVARLDWAVHAAERAADAPAPHGLELLATVDPSLLQLQLAAGTALIESAHPVVTIWHAHRRVEEEAGGDRFAAVRAAFAAGGGETALVFRQGWAPRVIAVDAAEASFTRALLDAQPLASALQRAGESFPFQAWLIGALQQQRLLGATELPTPTARGSA